MKIIYFVGFSAVGKKTTIRRILDGDPELRKRFGVSGRLYATGYAFDPLIRERCMVADTVLVQWQLAEHWKIRRLREWFPEAEHRVVFLRRDWESHLRSHRHKYRHLSWRPTIEDLKSHTDRILSRFTADPGPIEFVTLPEIPEPIRPGLP